MKNHCKRIRPETSYEMMRDSEGLYSHPVAIAPGPSGYTGVISWPAHLQRSAWAGRSEQIPAEAVAQYSLILIDIVIPGGHDRVGMQYVSKLEAPSTVVTLYH